MTREIISRKLVKTINEYGIVESKERKLDVYGKQYGRMQTWYDVCLDAGDGDIVYSCRNLIKAERWTKEN